MSLKNNPRLTKLLYRWHKNKRIKYILLAILLKFIIFKVLPKSRFLVRRLIFKGVLLIILRQLLLKNSKCAPELSENWLVIENTLVITNTTVMLAAAKSLQAIGEK